MKKSKTSKKTAELPALVDVMMKVAERLELLEKKTDQMMGRLTSLPSEMRQAVQGASRQEPLHGGQAPQNQRILYQAVCADCFKSCEVPFKPGPDRPVYCKACFVIRKAGHVPQDPDKPSRSPIPSRPVSTIPRDVDEKPVLSGKSPKKSGKQKKGKKKK